MHTTSVLLLITVAKTAKRAESIGSVIACIAYIVQTTFTTATEAIPCLICQRKVDGDNITLLDQIIQLSKVGSKFPFLLFVQMLVIKVQYLLQIKCLHCKLC